MAFYGYGLASNSSYALYGQAYDYVGNKVSGSFIINYLQGIDLYYQKISLLSSCKIGDPSLPCLVCVWHHKASELTQFDIYGQLISISNNQSIKHFFFSILQNTVIPLIALLFFVMIACNSSSPSGCLLPNRTVCPDDCSENCTALFEPRQKLSCNLL